MKYFFAILTHIMLFPVFSSVIIAQESFQVQSKSEYKFSEDGYADVTNTVRITNLTSELAPSSYKITFSEFNPENFVAYEGSRVLRYELSNNERVAVYTVFFEKDDIGADKEKSFLYNYRTDKLASKYEGGYELNLPYVKKAAGYSNSEVTVLVPNTFGPASYTSEQPLLMKQTNLFYSYSFSSNTQSKEYLYLSFGDFSTYNFDISYNLENPLNTISYTQVALIPDTDYQTVYYDEISPAPEKIFGDSDGNWLALLKFEPRQKVNFKINGIVQVFDERVRHTKVDPLYLERLTVPNQYWESDDTKIKELSNSLKDPRSIFYFVTNTLKYNFNKDPLDLRALRKGAVGAIVNPLDSVCTEYTDTFVALSRALGVPAREINGYAYSEDPFKNPISITQDVLHSWAEFYDDESGYFKAVDPTWTSTSGLNYFDNFDTKHIVFVIHGTSSTKPFSPGTYKLGNEPKKDVFIDRTDSPKDRKPGKLEIAFYKQFSLNPFNVIYKTKVKNIGGSALYDVNPKVQFQNTVYFSKQAEKILPSEEMQFEFNVPVGFLGMGTPKSVEVIVADKSTILNIEKYESISIQLICLFGIGSTLASFAIGYYKLRIQK